MFDHAAEVLDDSYPIIDFLGSETHLGILNHHQFFQASIDFDLQKS